MHPRSTQQGGRRAGSTLLLAAIVLVAFALPAQAGGEEATLTAGNGEGTPGGSVAIPVLLDGSAIEPTGASVGIAHDGEVLTLTEISMGAAVETLFDEEGDGFWVVNIDPAGGPGGFFAVAALFGGSIIPLPSEDDLELAVYHYEISDDAEADSSTDLLFTEELAATDDAPPVAIEVVDGIEQSILTLEAGQVGVLDGKISFVQPPGSVFVRGDIGGDGNINIRDAVLLLSYGFGGGKEPACMDAADVDDDGEVTNLTDPLKLLQWMFLEAAPPPAPGAECGIDPTHDNVDCLVEPEHCVHGDN